MGPPPSLRCRISPYLWAVAVVLLGTACTTPRAESTPDKPPVETLKPVTAAICTGTVATVTQVGEGPTELVLDFPTGQTPEPGTQVHILQGDRLAGTALVMERPAPGRALAKMVGLSDRRSPVLAGDTVTTNGALPIPALAEPATAAAPTVAPSSDPEVARLRALLEAEMSARATAVQREQLTAATLADLLNQVAARSATASVTTSTAQDTAMRERLIELETNLNAVSTEHQRSATELAAARQDLTTATSDLTMARKAMLYFKDHRNADELGRLQAERDLLALQARVLRLSNAEALTALQDQLRTALGPTETP